MTESPMKDAQDQRLPVWLVPMIVILIGGAFYAVFTAGNRLDGTERPPNLPWNSAEADALRNADLAELQRVMAGDDLKRARTAAILLTGRGIEGWEKIFEVVAEADEAVQYEVQTRTQADFVIEAAARTIESGSPEARQGAYVVLERQFSGWIARRTEEAMLRAVLSRIPPDDAEFDKLYSVAERFHPGALAPLFTGLADKPRSARMRAVAALSSHECIARLCAPREGNAEPEESLVKEVEAAVAQILAAAGG